MGNSTSTGVSTGTSSRQTRVLLVGLDNAGKTSILRGSAGAICPPSASALSDYITPTPTMEVSRFRRFKRDWIVYDMSGQGRYRPFWSYYYGSCDAVIFVVDAADADRLGAARDELHAVAAHIGRGGSGGSAGGGSGAGYGDTPGMVTGAKTVPQPRIPILIYANKDGGGGGGGGDVASGDGGAGASSVQHALQLELLQARHQVRVRLQRCNGVSGRGVADGFSWLCQNVGAQATVQ